MTAEAVVRTAAEAARMRHGAALVLDPLREFLDAARLGVGALTAEAIGDGHSNLSFLLRRGPDRMVLRRPPRGEISASANDVIRESRVLDALAGTAVPAPRVLARCEDERVIGAPFFVMSFIEGENVAVRLPDDLDAPAAGDRIADELIAALGALHVADLESTGLDAFGRGSGYLERQVRRFGTLLDQNATRPLPDLELVADWLAENLPASSEITFVHGDYRLGNLLYAPPLRLAAVLDWEMATLGDPLADLGYLTATWAEPGEPPNPMASLSHTTARADFPDRSALARLYSTATGRDVSALPWYQVLALWKAAIFLEGSYRRHTAGASADPFFATLDAGVPALAAACRKLVVDIETSFRIPPET